MRVAENSLASCNGQKNEKFQGKRNAQEMNAEHGRGEREQRQRECERHAWDYESRTF